MTKKEEAFKLFEEGQNPFSPEVKAFKLKSQTRYNYYLEWQEGGGITPSSAPSGEAKGKSGEAKEEQEEAKGESREAKGKERVGETRTIQ